MIVHDLADLWLTLIARAILTVGAAAGLGAALVALCVWLLTSVLTGNWPRRRVEEPAAEYEEAA